MSVSKSGALILQDNYRRDTVGGRFKGLTITAAVGGPPLLVLLSENSPPIDGF